MEDNNFSMLVMVAIVAVIGVIALAIGANAAPKDVPVVVDTQPTAQQLLANQPLYGFNLVGEACMRSDGEFVRLGCCLDNWAQKYPELYIQDCIYAGGTVVPSARYNS